MELSERSALAREEDPTREAADRRRERGDEVLDLTVTTPPSAIAPTLAKGGRDALAADLALDGLRLPPSRLIPTVGLEGALEALFTLLCDPGDEILVPEPTLVPLDALAHASGVSLTPYPLALASDGQPDAAALWDAIGPRTRALVAAHPCATGASLRADTLDALGALELPLIIDERAYGLALDVPVDAPRVHLDRLAFSVDGLEHRVAGAGLSWIAVHGPAAEADPALTRLRELTRSRTAAPPLLEAMASGLLAHAREQRGSMIERARAALTLARSALTGTPVEVPTQAGGLRAALRLPREHGSSEELALALVDEGVLLEPGSRYGWPDHQTWLVVGLLTPHDVLRRGLARLRARVTQGHTARRAR